MRATLVLFRACSGAAATRIDATQEMWRFFSRY